MDRSYCRKSTRELGRTSIYNLRRNLRERANDNAAEQQREIINIEAQAAEEREVNYNAAEQQREIINIEAQAAEPVPVFANNVERCDLNENGLEQNRPPHNENDGAQHVVIQNENAADVAAEDIPQFNNNIDEEEEMQELQESDDDEDDGDFEMRGVQPLYAGADITVKETMVLILSLMLRHNLSATCVGDIFNALKLICPRNGFKSLSLYKFTKYFSLGKCGDFVKHYYCSLCQASLPSKDAECHICVQIDTKAVHYFITLPFHKQLKEMLRRDNFYQLLQHRFNRGDVRQGVIQDICDGDLYRSQAQRGYLTNQNDISLLWYTDGVPVFKSSKTSMWPIYLSVCELPYHHRIRQENIMLAGLWFGKTKPEPNLFITKLRPEFEALHRGRNFTLPNGNDVRIRAILLIGTSDVPAKTHFHFLTLYSGAFGCNNCRLRGHTFNHNNGGHSHVFPYERNIVERTSQETIELGRRVVREGIVDGIMGVRGVSPLHIIMPDFLGGQGIDEMHKVHGGCVKKLLYLWFDSSYSGQPFSLRLMIANIDARLTSIKPPKHVHRMPRTITELCHWKCSELKMWFYYFSLPVLSGLMQPVYFNHFCLFVLAISLLNTDKITETDLRKANKLLHKFVREFGDLYGERQLTINIHGLLHLAPCVARIAGLFHYSCFPYEDLNGKLLKHIHGTSHLDSQLATRHCQVIKLQKKLESLRDGPVRDFVLNCGKKQVSINERLFTNCYSVGPYKPLGALHAQIRATLDNLHLNPGRVVSYHRLLKDGKLYVSESYPRSLKTSSAYVVFRRGGLLKVGCVTIFIKVSNCNCQNNCQCLGEHYAILNDVLLHNTYEAIGDDNRSYGIWHLKQCTKRNIQSALPVRDLVSVCVYVACEGMPPVIGLPINYQEKE